jgi:bacterioferritin-associated ferredoxin
MYICLCHGITEKQIRACVQSGEARTMCELRGQLGVATQCGCCEGQASELLDEVLRQDYLDSAGPDVSQLATAELV